MRQAPPCHSSNYPDPVKLSQKNAKLNTRIKQPQREKNASSIVLFSSYNGSYWTVEGHPICSSCKNLIHIERV